jgi:hypothetical protein
MRILKYPIYMSPFQSVIVIAFQNIFYTKMHQNNIFYF